MSTGPDKDKFYQACLMERSRLISSKAEATKSFDQALLTFTSGGLVLSVTFVEKIVADPPESIWLLYSTWILFGLSLSCVLLSFLFSQAAFQREIDAVDRRYRAFCNELETPITLPSSLNAWTNACNRIAAGAFFFGIATFIFFGATNWSRNARDFVEASQGATMTQGRKPSGENIERTTVPRILEKGLTADSAFLPHVPASSETPASNAGNQTGSSANQPSSEGAGAGPQSNHE